MTTMVSDTMNWKWNRANATPFYTTSWQQDYAQNNTNLKWIEHCWAIDINNTALPKPIYFLEAVRDLERTFAQYGRPGQICWLPNDQMVYGTWGAGNTSNAGPQNPGPLSVYTQPLGSPTTPSNPITQVIDTNGNFQVLTTYGTTGATQPSWPSANAAAGMTTADGSCVWTVVDPKGEGFRLNPIPPLTGVVYQINPVCQKKPVQFTTMSQTLDPIPDDYAKYFRQGFVAYCYRHSKESDVREKFPVEQALWMEGMKLEAITSANREKTNPGFYPDQSVMAPSVNLSLGPAWPYSTT